MPRIMHHKMITPVALAGFLGPWAVFAHSGVDAESGLLTVTVHEWLHAAGPVPVALLGAFAAIAAMLLVASGRRRADRKERR